MIIMIKKYRGVSVIHTIRELIENKSVLILGYGREGRSSWQRIKEAGGYSRVAIADMNHVQLEEGHPAELICGPDYQKCLDDFDVVFKSPGIVLERDIHDYRCEIVSQTFWPAVHWHYRNKRKEYDHNNDLPYIKGNRT